MDLTPDPLLVQLRKALRSALATIPVSSEVHGTPVADAARPALDRLDVAAFERPAALGGLDLGLTAGVLVSEELGYAARGNPYRADALAADVGCPAGTALAGFERLPGIPATPHAGGWVLTGTGVLDGHAGAGVLVATTIDEPVLVSVSRGFTVETGCRPPVARFDATPVTSADVVAKLDDSLTGPLARARLRQAAYLLGIATGAHRIAVRYAGERRQFDTRLRDLPAVAFPLAQAEVALRATRASVYRGAWLIDSGQDKEGTAPIAALAMAAETARDVVRACMQSCGVRAMTPELGLHRYFLLAAAESARWGESAALWRLVGAARLTAAQSQEN